MKDTIENHYRNLLVGAEDWAIEQVEEEIRKLEADKAEILEALRLLNAHYDDIGKHNKGWVGKIVLSDYALWNQALMATTAALRKFA